MLIIVQPTYDTYIRYCPNDVEKLLVIVQNDVEDLLVIVQTTWNNYQLFSNRRKITISYCPNDVEYLFVIVQPT